MSPHESLEGSSGPEEIRTLDFYNANVALYQAELQAHIQLDLFERF